MITVKMKLGHSNAMKTSLPRLGLLSALFTALMFTGACQCSPPAGATSTQTPARDGTTVSAVQTRASQAAMTPEQALEELREGNARFAAGKPRRLDLPAQVSATATGQYPFAIVLSCIDSRQPSEIVFDQGIGDIFTARVAGNVLNDDILGSMEFACKVAGAKLIVVIGHSNCGAIKGAVDDVQLGNLTGLLAKIKPAIDAVPADIQPRTSKNHAFVDEVAQANVKLVMKEIRERSPILREMLSRGEIELVGGMYDLATGKVQFYDKETD